MTIKKEEPQPDDADGVKTGTILPGEGLQVGDFYGEGKSEFDPGDAPTPEDN